MHNWMHESKAVYVFLRKDTHLCMLQLRSSRNGGGSIHALICDDGCTILPDRNTYFCIVNRYDSTAVNSIFVFPMSLQINTDC